MTAGKRKYTRHTCAMCPKWYLGYCSIYARVMVAQHPVCDAGKRFIANETSRRWMAAHRKGATK